MSVCADDRESEGRSVEEGYYESYYYWGLYLSYDPRLAEVAAQLLEQVAYSRTHNIRYLIMADRLRQLAKTKRRRAGKGA